MNVAPATAAELPAACRFLFAHAPFADLAAARFHEFLTNGELDPGGLIVAADGDGLRGVTFACRIGGRQAAVWLPTADSAAVEDALMAGVLDWVLREPTTLVQAIVRPTELPRTPPLVRAGFRHVTRLSFLTRELSATSLPPLRTELQFIPVPTVTPAFANLLLRTYDGTRDIPELNGHRTGEDILAGYLTAHRGQPPQWWRVEHAGAAVGVLLLSPTDIPAATELTYLGLLPAARGRGWGREAVQFALCEVALAGGRSVVLNVDVRNEPALRLYRAADFHETDRREVFLLFP